MGLPAVGLSAACLGQVLGFGGGTAGAGHIGAGTKIIVLSQTLRTHVDLVDLAMDHRQISVANVTTATDTSGRVLGFSRGRLGPGRSLDGASFEKNSRGCGQGSQGHAARTQDQKTSVRMFAQGCGQHDQSDNCSQRSKGDQPVAHL